MPYKDMLGFLQNKKCRFRTKCFSRGGWGPVGPCAWPNGCGPGPGPARARARPGPGPAPGGGPARPGAGPGSQQHLRKPSPTTSVSPTVTMRSASTVDAAIERTCAGDAHGPQAAVSAIGRGRWGRWQRVRARTAAALRNARERSLTLLLTFQLILSHNERAQTHRARTHTTALSQHTKLPASPTCS